MLVGFTGTRDETTVEQHGALCRLVKSLTIAEFHHGCCAGADAEAVDVVTTWAPAAVIVAHPPEKQGHVSRLSIDVSHKR